MPELGLFDGYTKSAGDFASVVGLLDEGFDFS